MSGGHLESSLWDVSLTGAKDARLTSISFDFDKKEIVIGGQMKNITLVGRYNVSGKLMSLPLAGEGTMKVSFYDCDIKYTTSYNLTKLDNGEVYLVL
ncbi:hypothetical protein L798_12309 [Zootermopsis nevadensis]|uniref:Uncharacterized protein n=1 Tax=Zootermopsis nevadensis TaxID=136037 RepID=A0A067RSS6_ZOONE|nr:hypothetical protein L798_12309 [Zootermopsis nevadensis]